MRYTGLTGSRLKELSYYGGYAADFLREVRP